MDAYSTGPRNRSLITVICSFVGLAIGFGLIFLLPKALWVPLAPVCGPILGMGIGQILERRGVGPHVSRRTAANVLAGLAAAGVVALVIGLIVCAQF